MKKAKAKAPARKAAKAPRSVAKTKAATKTAAKKPSRPAAKTSPAKGTSTKAAAVKATKPVAQPASTTPRKPLTLPVAPAPQAVQAPAKSAPTTTAPPKSTAPKAPAAASGKPLRADVPPESGFTILVDGHFKNQFDALADARTAAADLKSRFPILRIEIYDAAKKTRHPI